MTAINRNYKADTRGLFIGAGGGAASLVTNHATGFPDLVSHTTYLTQTGSALAIRSPRELSVVCNLTNVQSGIILNYGSTDGTQYIYRVDVSAGSVNFRQNGTLLASMAAPGVTGTSSSYIIHWSTGFDALASTHFSEFALCRLASGVWTITRATHAQPPAAIVGWQFNLLGYGAGSSIWTGGVLGLTSVRVGRRFHSTTEAREDWQTESAAPSPLGYVAPVELAPLSVDFYEADPSDDVADALLDPSTFAGPAEWLAALHSGSHRQRLTSPLINLEFNNPPTLQSTWAPASFYRVGASGLQYGVNHLYAAPVPSPGTSVRARVSVQVQTWIAAGAPGGTTPRLELAMRSSADPEALQGYQVTSVATCTTNHTSTGVGQWIDLGEMPLLFDAAIRITYLALGLSFGSGVGNTFRRARIKAIKVENYIKV